MAPSNIEAKPLIQVAGVKDLEEARMLRDSGVDLIGFPLRLALHKEDTTEDEAAAIIRSAGLSRCAVLITYLDRAQAVLGLCQKLNVLKVQLHSDVPADEIRKLRSMGPRIFVIKSLVVRGSDASRLEGLVAELSPLVDAFITDTYDASTGACGATGKTHDWDVSRRLADISPRPVILAGGLRPENVAEAIRHVRPAGVDVHTGVEGPDGRKDAERVHAFVMRARSAFAALGHRGTVLTPCGC